MKPSWSRLHGFDFVRLGASLRANLHHAVVLAGRLDHLLPFPGIVAGGFFDVDVFTCLDGPDGGQRVPVIGERHRYRLHALIVEDLPHVGIAFGLAPVAFSTRAWPRSRAAWSTSQSATMRASGSFRYEFMWSRPRPPKPTTATLTLSSAPRRADVTVAAAAVERKKNFLLLGESIENQPFTQSVPRGRVTVRRGLENRRRRRAFRPGIAAACGRAGGTGIPASGVPKQRRIPGAAVHRHPTRRALPARAAFHPAALPTSCRPSNWLLINSRSWRSVFERSSRSLKFSDPFIIISLIY